MKYMYISWTHNVRYIIYYWLIDRTIFPYVSTIVQSTMEDSKAQFFAKQEIVSVLIYLQKMVIANLQTQ